MTVKPTMVFFPLFILYIFRGVIMAVFRLNPAGMEEGIEEEVKIKP